MIKNFTVLKKWRGEQLAILILLISGIFLRLFHYLENRSLWEDEVFLASSLIHMNFYELATLPLEYQQRAPVGFLWLSHLSVALFDKKEMSLRLFPFICGIVSIFAFLPVAKFYLQKRLSILVAIAIAMLAPPLIYHSVEAKQYGTEFLSTVLSLYLFVKFGRTKSAKHLIYWGLGGAVVLWFSFSALFVLGGMAAAISLTSMIKKEWERFFLCLIPFGMWLVSFVIQYVFFISKFPEEEWLVQFWRNRDAFMPFPPHSLSNILWPFNQIYSLIRYPMGLSWFDLDYEHPYSPLLRVLARMPFLPILIGLVGLRELFIRQKQYLLLYALPVILALAASSLELYPLRERLTLFLAPIFILVIGKGFDALAYQKIPGSVQQILAIFIIAAPFLNSARQVLDTDLFGDYKKSRQREAMQYMQKNYKQGDVVYVYWNDLPSYRYYEEAYHFNFNTIYGNDVRSLSTDFTSYFKNLSTDFDRIKKHNRFWYIYRPANNIKLGDIENQPAWYFVKVNATGKVRNEVSKLGRLVTEFPEKNLQTDVKACLFKQ